LVRGDSRLQHRRSTVMLKDGGKLNDWVPVLIVALVVVCVTAFLLLDPKSRTPRKDR
jgi:hypothetical protein